MADPVNPGQPSTDATERGSPLNVNEGTIERVSVTRMDVATGEIKELQAQLLQEVCDCIEEQTGTIVDRFKDLIDANQKNFEEHRKELKKLMDDERKENEKTDTRSQDDLTKEVERIVKEQTDAIKDQLLAGQKSMRDSIRRLQRGGRGVGGRSGGGGGAGGGGGSGGGGAGGGGSDRDDERLSKALEGIETNLLTLIRLQTEEGTGGGTAGDIARARAEGDVITRAVEERWLNPVTAATLAYQGVMAGAAANIRQFNATIVRVTTNAADLSRGFGQLWGETKRLFELSKTGLIELDAIYEDLGAGALKQRDSMASAAEMIQKFSEQGTMLMGTFGRNVEEVATTFRRNRDIVDQAFGSDFMQRFDFRQQNEILSKILIQQRGFGVQASNRAILEDRATRTQIDTLKMIAGATGKTVEAVMALQEKTSMTAQELAAANVITEEQGRNLTNTISLLESAGMGEIGNIILDAIKAGGAEQAIQGLIAEFPDMAQIIQANYGDLQRAFDAAIRDSNPERAASTIQAAFAEMEQTIGGQGMAAARFYKGQERFFKAMAEARRRQGFVVSAAETPEEQAADFSTLMQERMRLDQSNAAKITGAVNDLGDWLENNLGKAGPLVLALGLNTAALIINTAALLLKGLFGLIKFIFKGGFRILKWLFGAFMTKWGAGILGFLGKWWDKALGFLGNFWKGTKDLGKAIWKPIGDTISKLLTSFKNWLKPIFEPLLAFMRKIGVKLGLVAAGTAAAGAGAGAGAAAAGTAAAAGSRSAAVRSAVGAAARGAGKVALRFIPGVGLVWTAVEIGAYIGEKTNLGDYLMPDEFEGQGRTLGTAAYDKFGRQDLTGQREAHAAEMERRRQMKLKEAATEERLDKAIMGRSKNMKRLSDVTMALARAEGDEKERLEREQLHVQQMIELQNLRIQKIREQLEIQRELNVASGGDRNGPLRITITKDANQLAREEAARRSGQTMLSGNISSRTEYEGDDLAKAFASNRIIETPEFGRQVLTPQEFNAMQRETAARRTELTRQLIDKGMSKRQAQFSAEITAQREIWGKHLYAKKQATKAAAAAGTMKGVAPQKGVAPEGLDPASTVSGVPGDVTAPEQVADDPVNNELISQSEKMDRMIALMEQQLAAEEGIRDGIGNFVFPPAGVHTPPGATRGTGTVPEPFTPLLSNGEGGMFT